MVPRTKREKFSFFPDFAMIECSVKPKIIDDQYCCEAEHKIETSVCEQNFNLCQSSPNKNLHFIAFSLRLLFT